MDESYQKFQQYQEQVSNLSSILARIRGRLQYIAHGSNQEVSLFSARVTSFENSLQSASETTLSWVRPPSTNDTQSLDRVIYLSDRFLDKIEEVKSEVIELCAEATSCYARSTILGKDLLALCTTLEERSERHQKNISDIGLKIDQDMGYRDSLKYDLDTNSSKLCHWQSENERWETAHDILKYIPGVDFLSYPITKIGTRLCASKVEKLNYSRLVLREKKLKFEIQVLGLIKQLAENAELLRKGIGLMEETKKLVKESEQLQQLARSGNQAAYTVRPKLDHARQEVHGVVERLKVIRDCLPCVENGDQLTFLGQHVLEES
ncbi:hypothetical protein GGR58DRAFT_488775 [Xylaria digitata]|nr:hypothetical protein GGR58DRAFT_488775 [Xylaria digitata]